jgi:hypothetical protein
MKHSVLARSVKGATMRQSPHSTVRSLSQERASQVLACYPEVTPDMVRLRFELVADSQLHHDSAV